MPVLFGEAQEDAYQRGVMKDVFGVGKAWIPPTLEERGKELRKLQKSVMDTVEKASQRKYVNKPRDLQNLIDEVVIDITLAYDHRKIDIAGRDSLISKLRSVMLETGVEELSREHRELGKWREMAGAKRAKEIGQEEMTQAEVAAKKRTKQREAIKQAAAKQTGKLRPPKGWAAKKGEYPIHANDPRFVLQEAIDWDSGVMGAAEKARIRRKASKRFVPVPPPAPVAPAPRKAGVKTKTKPKAQYFPPPLPPPPAPPAGAGIKLKVKK